jgi:hypothetical protein
MTPETSFRPTKSLTTDARPNTTQSIPVIELVGVSKVFGAGPDAVRALSPIDLKIESGTFFLLSARPAAASQLCCG